MHFTLVYTSAKLQTFAGPQLWLQTHGQYALWLLT